MDNCWISCQVMADLKIIYDDLIIINLYLASLSTDNEVLNSCPYHNKTIGLMKNCTPSPFLFVIKSSCYRG